MKQKSISILKFIFLILFVLICFRVVYNIETDGQQGNLVWEFGKATKDVLVDWWTGFNGDK